MKNTVTLFILTFISLSGYKCNAQQINANQIKATTMRTTPVKTEKNLLTAKERDYAVQFLKETESGFFDAVKSLNEVQSTFKPAAGKWSVEDCVKHIASAEKVLWAMIEESLKQPVNPEKREGIKFTDQELIKAVEDRSQKSKTFEALEPANSNFKTMAEALASFKENREKLINFVNSTKEDLRNHVSVLPIGTYDAYQFILLISAHTNRHTQQIEEIKANIDYPKK
jgi:methyl-accepting chemotaxis protein